MPARLVECYYNESEEADDPDNDGERDQTEPDDNRPAFGATPITSAAESLTGYVTVTAEVATTQCLGDDEKGTKAIPKGKSGAIDLVVWDGDIPDRLEALEGEHVGIKNAEVTEYEGVRQLSFADDLTEIHTIQQGVGYTEPRSAAAGQGDLEAATDGSGDFEGARAIVNNHLAKQVVTPLSLA